MNKDEIKKALQCCYDSGSETYCSDCAYHNAFRCNDMLCKDALSLITEQENEIEYRKKQHDNQVSENTRLYIEYDKLKDDYAKLQEKFAKYQMSSDKEIVAQKKEAVKKFAEKLTINALRLSPMENYHVGNLIDELLKEYEE